MKSAVLAHLDNVLRTGTPEAFEQALRSELEREEGQPSLALSSNKALRLHRTDPHRIFPTTRPSVSDAVSKTQYATLLHISGVRDPRIDQALGDFEHHKDASDEPDVQVLALLYILQDGDGELPDFAQELAIERLQTILMEHPVLMHPLFVWDFRTRHDYNPTPLLHAYMEDAFWPLPTSTAPASPRLASLFSDDQRRAWARHPAVTAALQTPSEHLVNRKLTAAVKKTPGNIHATVNGSAAVRVESMLALARLRREPLRGEPRVGEDDDVEGEGFFYQVTAQFRVMRDRDDATYDANGNIVLDPQWASMRAELRASSPAVKRWLQRVILASANGAVGWTSGEPQEFNPVARIHRFIGELAACGVKESPLDAARNVALSILVSYENARSDFHDMLARMSADRAQGILLALSHHGIELSELKEMLLRSFLPDHAQAPFLEACDALLTQKSMNSVLAASTEAGNEVSRAAERARRAAL